MSTTLIITVVIIAFLATLYVMVRYRMKNIEQYQSLAQKFQVRNIPTLILLKNGVEVNRFVGVKSKEYLLQQIRKS